MQGRKNEDLILDWVLSKMEGFGKFLGLSYEGFEEEAQELFQATVKGRLQELKDHDYCV